VTAFRIQPDEGPAASRPLDDSAPRNGNGAGPRHDLTERVVDTKVLHRGRYLEFRIVTIERPDGTRSTRDIAGHPGAVAILAVDDDDNVLMVRQYRVATGESLVEIPAGTLDVDPETGTVEDHAAAAARELEEETGYRARAWKRIASFWTAPGFATEFMHLYLATNLVVAEADRIGPDEDENLELVRLPISKAVEAAERGEVRDAKSLVGLFWLARLMSTPTAAPMAQVAPVAPVAPVASVARVANDPPGRTANAGAVAGMPAAPVPLTAMVPPPGAYVPGDRRVVEAEFTLRSSDIYAANMALSRANRVLLAEAIVVVLAGIVLFLNGSVLLALALLVFGLAGLFGVVSVPLVWFRMRQRPELFGQKSSVAADDIGLRYDTPLASGTYPWSAFRRVREMDGFMFFDSGIGPSLFVPLSAFRPEALSHLRKLLLGAGFATDGHAFKRR
jgi:ADP-ribose pyrophosphatase